jgi:hypothetical protein
MEDWDDEFMPSDEALTRANSEKINELRSKLLQLEASKNHLESFFDPDLQLRTRIARIKVVISRRERELQTAELFRNKLLSNSAAESEHQSVTSRSNSEQPHTGVPRVAEFLLDLLLSPKEQESGIGDLQELYTKRVAKVGTARAKLWIYTQVLRSATPLLWRLVTLGWVAEWIRRHIS